MSQCRWSSEHGGYVGGDGEECRQTRRNGARSAAEAGLGLGDHRTKSKNHTGVITDRGMVV